MKDFLEIGFTQFAIRIVTPTGTITYEYDGRKERILQTVTGATTVSTLYLRGLNNYPLMEKTNTGTPGSISMAQRV